MASTPKLTTTISSFPSLQILCRKLPIAINLPSSSTSRSLPKTLSHLSSLHRPRIASVSNHRDIISLLHRYYHSSSRCCFSIRAQNADNGADSDRRYDFDLFTPSAPVAAATSYGTSAAVCELPFSTISSERVCLDDRSIAKR
uniref:Uncharacterized protein n=1 Tax=Brassica oleracea var. oleracea TaxID=109376 RepID=A0A0D3BD49_BRAOL